MRALALLPVHPMLRPLALVALLALPPAALAGPVTLPPGAGTPPIVTYVDRGLTIEVRPSATEVAPGLTAITLLYPDGRHGEAAVDDTAIVVTSSIDQLEREAHVRRVELLMPGEGMWVVRGLPGETGVAVAARLSARLREDGLVQQAVPNLYLARRRMAVDERVPNDPGYEAQWFFDDLRLPQAWALEWGSSDVSVVVLDTGCDPAHPDLQEKYLPGRDVVSGDDDPTVTSDGDGAFHGTSCAGLVAASTDNDRGVAGACPACMLRCVRLLPVPNRVMPISKDVAAFQFVIDSGAAVASNSWGYDEHIPAPGPLATAISAAFDHGRNGLGTVIVFAAGNEDREVFDDEIVGLRGVIGVGAITHYQELTSYSNFGSAVDLVAPVGTVTTDLSGTRGSDQGDYTGSFGGTSSSCPIVAGIAGLLASARPELTAAELTDLLLTHTTPALYALPDENGHDALYGYGVVDPVRALKAAKGIVDVPDAGPELDAGPAVDAGHAAEEYAFVGGGGGFEDCGCASGGPGALALLALGLVGLIRRRR